MESSQSTHFKNIGVLLHLSTFSKYFIPFGNFIAPLVFWHCNRKNPFIDVHGRECLNFQISTFLYVVAIGIIGVVGTLIFMGSIGFETIENSIDPINFQYYPEILPYFIFMGILGFLLLALFIVDLICVIRASAKAGEGKPYHYPISIPFLPKNGKENETRTTFKKETL